jgi:hypothetical protein
VRAGERELHGVIGALAGAAIVAGEIERAFADLAFDQASRLGAEAHAGHAAKCFELRSPEIPANPRHGADEVFDHAVGVGVVDVEAIKLAVGDDIDAGEFLGFENNLGRINQRLLARRGHQPVRDGVGADDGGADRRTGRFEI